MFPYCSTAHTVVGFIVANVAYRATVYRTRINLAPGSNICCFFQGHLFTKIYILEVCTYILSSKWLPPENKSNEPFYFLLGLVRATEHSRKDKWIQSFLHDNFSSKLKILNSFCFLLTFGKNMLASPENWPSCIFCNY